MKTAIIARFVLCPGFWKARAGQRLDQLVHPAYTKPELTATGPNQLWSWDITKLPGPLKWTYFCLCVILGVFSRYVVGWMVADVKIRSRPTGHLRTHVANRESPFRWRTWRSQKT